MEDGESDIGGSGAGYGGGDADQGGYGGLGIGNPGSYGGSNTRETSYSQEAMDSALAASTQQMRDNNVEYGLAQRADMDNQSMGQVMQDYTGGYPGIANTVDTRNQINNFKDQNPFGMYGMYKTAKDVGQDTGFMGTGLREKATEMGANFLGGLAGGVAGGMTGFAPAAIAGAKYGGQIGTKTQAMAEAEELDKVRGLVSNVTGTNTGALSKEETDGLIKRLMTNSGRV